MSVWIPVLVAVIGGPLMWVLHRFDKRNTEQHGQNLEVLNEIKSDVKEIRIDLYDHIVGHLKDKESA